MERDKLIRLTPDNYKQYMPVAPVAYSFAEPGACGAAGEIIICDQNGRPLALDYIRGCMSQEQIKELCPEIGATVFHIFGQGDTPPSGWFSVYLGLGNHLCVKKDVYPLFSAEVEKRGINSRGHLYQQWIDVILTVIGKQDVAQTSASEQAEATDAGAKGRGNFDTVANNSYVMFEVGYTVNELLKHD